MTLVPFRDMGAGLNLDGFPGELPDQQWSAARNMRFRDGYAEKSQGDARVHGDLLFDPYGLFPTQGVDGRYWVYAGLTKLAAVKNNTHTDITRTSGAYTGAIEDRWNGGVLSGVLVLNNGKDVPQFWGGNPATKAAELTAWPIGLRSKIVRPFRNHIFMLNNTQGTTRLPYSVRWSHPADPGTLPTSYDIADATKDAGQVDLADTPDEVVDGVPLGEQFIVYKENSIWAFDYVGAPYIWANKPISKEAGALGQDCAVQYPGGHAILTQGDIVRFDGATVASIADARVRRWLFNNLNADRYKRAFAVSNFRRNEVWFCFPQTGSEWCDTALIWNWKDDTWGVRDLPQIATGAAGTIVYEVGNSWDNDPEPWDTDDTTWNQYEYTQATPRLMLASAVNRKLLLTDTGKTFEGVPMRVLLERRGLAYGDPSTMKFCRGVRPRIEAPVGTQIDIFVGAQTDLDGPVEWAPAIPFIVGRDLKADCMVSGRYLAIRFESTGIVSWRVKQFDMDLQPMGGY